MRCHAWMLVALAAQTLTAGCFSEEDSCNVKTDGIYVQYEVTETSDSASAEVTFWVGNSPEGTYLVLGECGDEIRVNGQRLAQTGDYPVTYVAAIERAEAYDFVFKRSDERPYLSSVEVAEPLWLRDAPEPGDSVSRASDLKLSWETTSSDELTIVVSSDCLYDYETSTIDDGSFTIESGELMAYENEEDVTCDAQLFLRRQISGDLDSALKGTIRGTAETSRTFRTTP